MAKMETAFKGIEAIVHDGHLAFLNHSKHLHMYIDYPNYEVGADIVQDVKPIGY